MVFRNVCKLYNVLRVVVVEIGTHRKRSHFLTVAKSDPFVIVPIVVLLANGVISNLIFSLDDGKKYRKL